MTSPSTAWLLRLVLHVRTQIRAFDGARDPWENNMS